MRSPGRTWRAVVMLAMLAGGVLGRAEPALAFPWNLPPRAAEPVLDRIAPEKCLLYFASYGLGTADAASDNRTERMLADAEVRGWLVHLVKEWNRFAATDPPPHERELVMAINRAAQLVATRPAAVYVAEVSGPPAPGVRAGLAIQLGDDAADVVEAIETALAAADLGKPQERQVGGQPWKTIPLPLPVPLLFRVQDGWLYAAAGEQEAEAILARAKGQAVPAWLSEAREKLNVPRPSHLLHVALNSALQTALGLAPPTAQPAEEMRAQLALLGLDRLAAFDHAAGLDDAQHLSRSRLSFTGPPQGLFAPFAAAGLTAADLANVPQDAALALVARLDLDQAFALAATCSRVVGGYLQQQIDEALAQFREEAGFDLRQELLAAVGDRWTAYYAPDSVGPWHTGLVVSVSVRDRAAVAERLNQYRRFLDAAPRALYAWRKPVAWPRVREDEYEGQKIAWYRTDEATAFGPAWCLTDDELVFGLYPQTVRAHLAARKGKSLAEQPEVAKALADGGPTMLWRADSRRLTQTLYPAGLALARMFEAELRRSGFDLGSALVPTQRSLVENLSTSLVQVRRQGNDVWVESRQSLPGVCGLALAVAPVALPAGLGFTMEQRIGEPVPRSSLASAIRTVLPSARQRIESSNNLRQMLIAMHNYHDVHNRWPAAGTFSAEGKPLLSWRVQLLPYLEENALYQEFRQDEPWDSEHNMKLVARMPAIFKSPGSKAEAGKTCYVVPVHDESAFRPKGERLRIVDIPDGTSNTAAVIEVDDQQATIWTKPDGTNIDFTKPGAGLRDRNGQCLVGLCDGSARMLDLARLKMAEFFKAIITRGGGEAVQID